MLTKQDLSEIKNLLQPINNKLIEHDKEFKKIDIQLKGIHKQLTKNQKDHDTIIEYFDNNDIKHRERFDRIESHLGLPAII